MRIFERNCIETSPPISRKYFKVQFLCQRTILCPEPVMDLLGGGGGGGAAQARGGVGGYYFS